MMWATNGSAMGILAVGIGVVLGIGIALVFRGTRSPTARVVAAVLAVALGLVAARLIWPMDTTAHDWVEKSALAVDWSGVNEMVAGIRGGHLTLLPGQGSLWVEKTATSQAELEAMQVSPTKKDQALHLTCLSPAVDELHANLMALLEVPVQLKRVDASGSNGTLALQGLSLPELAVSGLGLHAIVSQIGRLELGPGVRSVWFAGGRVEEIDVQEASGPVFLIAKGITPAPEGTLIRSSRELLAELWLGRSFHLEVVVPVGGEVSLPPLPSSRWEELSGGKRVWIAGDEALPPIRIEMPKGRITLIAPEG